MRKLVLIAMALFICVLLSGQVLAQGSSSNYRIDESFIGPGGSLESNSTNYQTEAGSQSVGNPAAGGNTNNESSSTNFQSQAGASTTSDPSLTCTINSSSINFGALSTSVPSTGTATFSVLNYTAHGYIVQMIGAPPSGSGHTLVAMSSNGSSSPGTEQFGVNLVANTSPITFGADPVQTPSGTFSFGAAASNYDTPNSYRYVSGETVASAPKSSGRTDYTISYLINASNTTPGGTYSGSQTVVCIGTY